MNQSFYEDATPKSKQLVGKLHTLYILWNIFASEKDICNVVSAAGMQLLLLYLIAKAVVAKILNKNSLAVKKV